MLATVQVVQQLAALAWASLAVWATAQGLDNAPAAIAEESEGTRPVMACRVDHRDLVLPGRRKILQ